MKKADNHVNSLIAFLGIFFFLSILIVGCGPDFVLQGLLPKINGATTGPIGDTFGGTIGPLIALLATLVTFAAFWVQYVANIEQLKQFERQNQNDIIFKLFDDQESRIVNSKILEDSVEHNSYNTLSFLVQKINYLISTECLLLARQLICDDLSYATPLFFQKLSDPILPIPSPEDVRTFHATMAGMNRNDRWEYLKRFVGSVGNETEIEKDALRSVGVVNFYKIVFEERHQIYHTVFQRLNHKYGNFLDGYLNGWEFICEFISTSLNQELYIKYLHSRLSKYDKIIIFYFLGSGYASNRLITFFQTHNLLNGLHKYSSLIIDAPSQEELEAELFEIYKLVN